MKGNNTRDLSSSLTTAICIPFIRNIFEYLPIYNAI